MLAFIHPKLLSSSDLLFMCMSAFPCSNVCALCKCLVPAEAVKSPQTGVTEGCEHHVSAGTQTQILWKSNQRTHWAISLAPVVSFYFIMYILVH